MLRFCLCKLHHPLMLCNHRRLSSPYMCCCCSCQCHNIDWWKDAVQRCERQVCDRAFLRFHGCFCYKFLIDCPSHALRELLLLTIISSKSCNLNGRVKSPSEALCKGQPMQFEYLWLNGAPVLDPDCRSLPQRNDIHPSHPNSPSPSPDCHSFLVVKGYITCTLHYLFSNLRNLPTLSSLLLFPLSFNPSRFTSLYVFPSVSHLHTMHRFSLEIPYPECFFFSPFYPLSLVLTLLSLWF